LDDNKVVWPSAVVAIVLLLLIGTVLVASILKYSSVDDALRYSNSLAGLLGVVTGAFVSYFFTRGTVKVAQDAQRDATEIAKKAQQAADVQRHEKDLTQSAFAAVIGSMPPDQVAALQNSNPAVRHAVARQ